MLEGNVVGLFTKRAILTGVREFGLDLWSRILQEGLGQDSKCSHSVYTHTILEDSSRMILNAGFL